MNTPAPGIYRLTEDVHNPDSDARIKRDWRNAVLWQVGMRFVLVEYQDLTLEEMRRDAGLVGPGPTHWTLWQLGDSHTDMVFRWQDRPVSRLHQERLNSLLPKLERVTGPVADFEFWFAERGDGGARNLLQEAFVEGRIDLAWMEATYRRIFAEPDERLDTNNDDGTT